VRNATEPLNNNDEISEVREIILSGGDPLVLDDTDLDGLLNYIMDLYPGNRVRLHTRVPVMLPERVTPQLIDLLRNFRLNPDGGAVYVVLHVNHSNELSDEVVNAISAFVEVGIPVLSQSVLLRRVNDRFETLFDLYEKLADIRVVPYYLHQLDSVQGAEHLEVPTAKGQVLVSKLSVTLPGYAVPRYVREVPGESKKTRL
jgi:KamA family protein